VVVDAGDVVDRSEYDRFDGLCDRQCVLTGFVTLTYDQFVSCLSKLLQ